MKIRNEIISSVLLVWILAGVDPLHGQGNLTPPGPPAPTMKTLDQIEPRTPIASLPFTIERTGHYYVTTNLTGLGGQVGIRVEAGHVMLDLGGFVLTGVPASGPGIQATAAAAGLTVRNGTIQGWETGLDFVAADSTRIESVRVWQNRRNGIVAGRRASIRDCTAQSNGAVGIQAEDGARVMECVAGFNLAHGVAIGDHAIVSRCSAFSNIGDGFRAGLGSRFEDCVAATNGQDGFFTADEGALEHCEARENTANGIVTGRHFFITDSIARRNFQIGLVGGSGGKARGVTAVENMNDGISVQADTLLESCLANDNRGGGITAASQCTVRRAQAHNNQIHGIQLGDGGTIRDSSSQGNLGDGIRVTSECTVAGNSCRNNFNARDAAGIHLLGTDNSVKQNELSSNDRGLSATADGNLIIQNTAANNTINYVIGGAQTLGPIVQGGDLIDATNPWANFAF